MAKETCPICGAPTRIYMGNARKDRLCAKHADEFKSNLIIQCAKCGKWNKTGEICSCSKKPAQYLELPAEGFDKCILCEEETDGYAFCKECWKQHTYEELLDLLNGNISSTDIKDEDSDEGEEETNATENSIVTVNESNKSRCITCGIKTDGLLFCSSCYHKYKNKELLFKITNCTNVELLDEDYEGRYTCKDGHIVKSKSERDIDNYLFEHGISHAYEKELPYGASEKEIIHPDFYLPHYLGKDKHVYVEHWGYNENNIRYQKTKKFKMPIYQKMCEEQRLTLVCTFEKSDTGKIDTALERKLNKAHIKEAKINFDE